MKRRDFLGLAAVCGLMSALPQQGLSQAPVLTVVDELSGKTRHYTDDDLMALQQESFVTETIWTEGKDTFSGPSLLTVLQDAGIQNAKLRISAVNDYSVTVPASQLKDKWPILANRINGKPFPVRQKGPLWLMFPFDSEPALRTETNYTLCVWQLNKIAAIAE
ncbi:oxidoreductase [Thalassovita sp.]|uniref:oxidoreductase n=1 Tax=Thalassovita sp. TaxID=1979401 RepID=UPI0029DE73C0|nr:oxidoreductase [Thalassovita sp.]